VTAATGRPSVRDSASTRPNHAVITLDAVRFNIQAVLRSVEPAAVLASVRADAYGHGALEFARAAADAGAIGPLLVTSRRRCASDRPALAA
jgi:alanine racemase